MRLIRKGLVFSNMQTTRRDLLLGGSALLGGLAIAKPVRSALGSNSHNPPTVPMPSKEYVQEGLISQWDSFAGYNEQSGRFFDMISGTEVSDSKITRTSAGFMNYNGIGLVNLRTGLTPPENFTLEMCIHANRVEGPGSNRAEMITAYGFTSLMQYVGGWYCIANNGFTSYGGGAADRFTACFQIEGNNSTNPSFPRLCNLFFNGSQKKETVAKNVLGTTLGLGRNTYTDMDIDIYSLRLYGRALTASEIAANYDIDKRRFGL